MTITPNIFNPFRHPVDLTLSNGGLTASVSAVPNYRNAFSTQSKSAGRFTFAVHIDSVVGLSADIGIGFANGSAGDGTMAGQYLGWDTNAIIGYSDGTIWNNSNFVPGESFDSDHFAGARLLVAVDITARRMWFKVGSGNWNANPVANPTTGVGGFGIPVAVGTDLFVGISLYSPTNAKITIDFHPSDLPAGYEAWDEDTGPPYPRPAPPPFDYWQTIISQYPNSPVLTRIIGDFASYLDQTGNLDDFYDLIWNINTAQGYGLDVWGRIIGVSRTLQIPLPDRNLGFKEATTVNADPFNQSPFYAGPPLTMNYQLSDNAFRVLLFAKALANISDGAIPSINQLLLNLFPGRGKCYVTDNGAMTMTYTFEFPLASFELAIVSTSGVLPKPVGVQTSVVQL